MIMDSWPAWEGSHSNGPTVISEAELGGTLEAGSSAVVMGSQSSG